MPDNVKVPACGSVLQIDFGDGDGFEVMGQIDSLQPTGLTKSVNETPDLECEASANVGMEEPAQNSFTQFWDPQDVTHAKVDTNFIDSKSDLSKRNVTVQEVTPTYTTGAMGASASATTREYTAQIVSVGPEALQPQGHWKRQVGLLRTSDITTTTA